MNLRQRQANQPASKELVDALDSGFALTELPFKGVVPSDCYIKLPRIQYNLAEKAAHLSNQRVEKGAVNVRPFVIPSWREQCDNLLKNQHFASKQRARNSSQLSLYSSLPLKQQAVEEENVYEGIQTIEILFKSLYLIYSPTKNTTRKGSDLNENDSIMKENRRLKLIIGEQKDRINRLETQMADRDNEMAKLDALVHSIQKQYKRDQMSQETAMYQTKPPDISSMIQQMKPQQPPSHLDRNQAHYPQSGDFSLRRINDFMNASEQIKFKMVEKVDYNDLNEMVKEYLTYHGLTSALECFKAEEKAKAKRLTHTKQINKVPQDLDQLNERFPALYKCIAEEPGVEEEAKQLQKQQSSVLQSARQIFSIAINCLQQLHNIKDGNSMTENLGETIDNYKIQLGKYNQILSSEGRCDRAELFSEAVMNEHKQRLVQAKVDNNLKGIIEVLLSLRVNALQISPELRKNLVYELIRNDVFLLTTRAKNDFLIELLDQAKQSAALCHSLLALISVIVSTLKGVEQRILMQQFQHFYDYIVMNGPTVITRVIDLLRDQEDGSVNQRFCIAILQKVSIKEDTIPVFLSKSSHKQEDLIEWVLNLVERAGKRELHIFSLDFATALLANILHASSTQDYLQKVAGNPYTRGLITKLLKLLKEKIPTSVLMHLLICLSYLKRERFAQVGEECGFVEKVSEFVEYYSKLPAIASADGNTENGEIDKRTVLDLCAHMFHPRDGGSGALGEELSNTSGAGGLEYNDMRADDKIREFENEQGDLIFECFQDEEKMFSMQ